MGWQAEGVLPDGWQRWCASGRVPKAPEFTGSFVDAGRARPVDEADADHRRWQIANDSICGRAVRVGSGNKSTSSWLEHWFCSTAGVNPVVVMEFWALSRVQAGRKLPAKRED